MLSLQASLVKQDGNTVIAIGIGNATDMKELTNIASRTVGNKSLVYQVGDYEALQTLDSVVAHVACEGNYGDRCEKTCLWGFRQSETKI